MSSPGLIPHDRAADAAAYAIGALEHDESEDYRRHLDGCDQCREQVAAFQRVADALPVAIPQYPVPPALRRRVLREVQAERRVRRGVRRPRVALVAVTGLLLAVVLIGALRVSWGSREGARVLPATVVRSPGTAVLRIAGGHAELTVRHLPAPALGRIYEVWLKRPAAAPAPTKALFSVTEDGSADVGIPGGVTGVSEILVTQEPAGGSRVPTGRPVIVAATS